MPFWDFQIYPDSSTRRKNFMKKPKAQAVMNTPLEAEWPRAGRVARVRQPMNRRLMAVEMGDGMVEMVGVRDNAFYRAGERLSVARMSDGSLVDAKPKTNALLRGGQE